MALTSLGFDESFYLAQNTDVLAAILAGQFTSAQDHYNQFGAKELRAPNSYFDPKAYLANNIDVLNAGVDPFEHFVTFGAKEGRLPLYDSTFTVANAENIFDAEENFNGGGTGDLTETGQTFDESFYLTQNPDVKSAVDSGAFASGYHHWVLFGQFENRTAQSSEGGTLNASQNTGGATLALTTSDDTPATTEAGDTLTAGADTLDAGDVIDGKGGNDTLTISGNTQEAATITNVEEIITLQTDNVDLDKASGYTKLSIGDVAGGFSNIESSTATFGVSATNNLIAEFLFSTDVDQTGTSDNVSVNFDVAKDKTVSLQIQDADDGAANGDAIESITISGDFNGTGAVALDSADGQAATIAKVDATAVTSGMVLDLSDSTEKNDVTMGTGDDKVKIGNNELTFEDKIDGGDGTDTISVTHESAHNAAANFIGVSNFEKLEISDVVDGATDISALSFTDVVLAGGQSGATLTVKTGTTITYSAGGGGNGDIDLAASASDNEVVNLVINEAITAANDFAVNANVETLNIEASKGNVDFTGSSAVAAKNIVVTGSKDVDFGGTALGATVTTIDASALTGALTVAVATGTTSVKGGSKADTIDATGNTAGLTIETGAGKDVVTFAGNTTGVTTISDFTAGKDGDKIALTTDAAGTSGLDTDTLVIQATGALTAEVTVVNGAYTGALTTAAVAAQLATQGITDADVGTNTDDFSYILIDNGTDTALFGYADDDDAIIETDELSLVVTLTGVADATTVLIDNFDLA